MSNYFYETFNPSSMSVSVIKDKKRAAYYELQYMLMRIQKMFKWSGLPETIPEQFLNYYLFTNGHCIITEVKGDLYALTGHGGGEPDPYYRPTIYVVANPALKYSAELKINEECCLMRNDWALVGLMPLMSKYAVMLAENMLTVRTADVILRVMAMLTAPDDKSRAAAEIYLKKLEAGDLGVIGENPFFDGIKMQSPPSNNGSYLTQFIELHQYLRGLFFQELGIDAMSNMKRESLSEGETHLNEHTLLPLIDHLIDVRKQDIERLNSMYGLDVSIEFDSSWLDFRFDMEVANRLAENESIAANPLAETPENGPENPDFEIRNMGPTEAISTDSGEKEDESSSDETVQHEEEDEKQESVDETVDSSDSNGDEDNGISEDISDETPINIEITINNANQLAGEEQTEDGTTRESVVDE